MNKLATEQKMHTIFPWIGKQVRVTYDTHTSYTRNNDGAPKFTDTVEGRLVGISSRLGTYQNSRGYVHDLVIHTDGAGLVTISIAKTLTITAA